MNLKEILSILNEVAKENKIHTPYIVGGVPRNILLGKFNALNDVDITTGYDDVHSLADLFAKKLGLAPRVFEDGHRKVYVEHFQIDFSSHAVSEHLGPKAKGMSAIEKDAYSRDFTVNALFIPLDFSDIIDPTGKGVSDIHERKLNTPIDSAQVFRDSPNRIIRAFYYAAKYDLKISDEIKAAIKSNLDLLDTVKGRYSGKSIAAALREKPELLDDLIETGVLSHIPLTKDIVDILIKEKKLNKVI